MSVVTGKPAGGARELTDWFWFCSEIGADDGDGSGTFEEETLGHQLCKVQTVQGQSVVEHDAPEVEGVEDGSDSAGRCLRHGGL